MVDKLSAHFRVGRQSQWVHRRRSLLQQARAAPRGTSDTFNSDARSSSGGSEGGPGKQIRIFQGRFGRSQTWLRGEEVGEARRKAAEFCQDESTSGNLSCRQSEDAAQPQRIPSIPEERYRPATWSPDQTPGTWPSLTSLCSSRH